MKIRYILLSLILLTSGAYAEGVLLDSQEEARATMLNEELRCVVCQSESINDSEADMARDMRQLVREKIHQGWSDAQILSFMQSRYGDFILLRPPVQTNTYLLWALPFLFMTIASGLIFVLFRKRKESPHL